MYMQHLFHGRIQIVSLSIICLDSDVPCRTMGSFTSTVLILQAFLVPCDRGVSESQPVFVYPHILGYRTGRWYLLRPPHPRKVSKSFPCPFLTAWRDAMCQSEVKTPFSIRHCSWPVDMTQSRWSTADRLCLCLQSPSRCFCGEGGKREVFLFCQWVGEVLKL